jgi:hypothetical protein
MPLLETTTTPDIATTVEPTVPCTAKAFRVADMKVLQTCPNPATWDVIVACEKTGATGVNHNCDSHAFFKGRRGCCVCRTATHGEVPVVWYRRG